jgi:hypothetical protein
LDFSNVRVDFLVAIVLGLVGIVVLYLTARVLREVRAKSTNPTVDQVLGAVTKYVYFGVAAGERAVAWGINEINDYIDSVDKANVANFIYDLLPEVIVVDGIPIPVSRLKALVPRERWEAFVKDLYDEFNAFVHTHEGQLFNQVDAFLQDLDDETDEDLAGAAEGWLTPTKE